MGHLQLERIKSTLNSLYADKLELTNTNEDILESQIEKINLEKMLSAYLISFLGKISIDDSTNYITRVNLNHRLDAIYINDDIMYIINSNWVENDIDLENSINIDELIQSFVDLNYSSYDNLNDKLISRETEFRNAIFSTQISLKLIILHTCNCDLPKNVQEKLDNFLIRFNDSAEILSYETYNQSNLWLK